MLLRRTRRLRVSLLVLLALLPCIPSFAHSVARAAAAATLAAPPPEPVPIAGGDVLGPPKYRAFLVRQFLPGPDKKAGQDGVNAEPNGITNFRGLVALAYTTGTATDTSGRKYRAETDIRLYQGDYVAKDGRRAHGTFVEI
jgi:hypothetical protein